MARFREARAAAALPAVAWLGLRYAIEHTQLDIVVRTQCVQFLIQQNVCLFVSI